MTVAMADQETRTVVLRRRIVVGVVLVAGAMLQAYSLGREPGDTSFYWLTLAMAAVWTVGAIVSGPLQLGRDRRPIVLGTVVGLGLGAMFAVGGLIARLIPGLREYVTAVLEFANHGPLLVIVFITVINGVAEELFFRGALYTALGNHYPAVISTVIYVAAVMAAGNPMLGFAGILLGAVCAYERRMTGGVLAPMLTHFFWGLIMVLVLPPIFGV
ncbi:MULTISPECIES: CPBP family intramembrane glutamic endopeptidase [Mycolicibacterium]|uniref:Abortive infection protein n=1 Tax=Mycolicibacterium wolinskyi TaxID=59750 RepID=A0A132PL39_9MYCO|nr:CPBP family intramembrane glutamic endopeptidase [Mycolicibacterium wolinskyi]KWX22964.1 abortive infection protein [Mycolicibacterium wolinskyi]MCV7285952.1 CPBP family intramembrane metalloprotease [Mycolicibacterium wolinskyi]MCV7291021.1 CPBP family intramembrane metalloprotease [Mycolicibacterium goodii]ORX16327.1 abortive infection protein [Mycolicibacterium wolinskyi]